MDKRSWVLLIVGIILIGLFLISWLAFKDIRTSQWVALLIGIIDIVMVVIRLKKQ